MALREVELVIQSSQVPGALTDFPTLVARSNLPNEVCDPSGSNNAQSDGGDLKFYSDSALTTQLPCEVVSFAHDSVTNAADAAIEVWVKVPSVAAASNTSFYMTYNETTTTSQPAVTDPAGRNAVWSDYSAVYHLNEDGTGGAGSIVDSTGNGHDGTPAGATLTAGGSIAGQIGNALAFDGSADTINCGDFTAASVLVSATDTLISHWINPDAEHFDRWLLGIDTEWASQVDNETGSNSLMSPRFSTFGSNNLATVSETISLSTWQLIHQRVDAGASIESFVDGVSDGGPFVGSDTSADSGNSLFIASRAGSSSFFDGGIDEVRMRSDLASTDWITAEYNNQSSPSTFIVEGTPADSGGGGGGGISIPVVMHHLGQQGIS